MDNCRWRDRYYMMTISDQYMARRIEICQQSFLWSRQSAAVVLLFMLQTSSHGFLLTRQRTAFSSLPYPSPAFYRMAVSLSSTSRDVVNGKIDHILPNWRVFDKPQDSDHRPDRLARELARRAPWSAAAFQDALDLYEQVSACDDAFIQTSLQEALNSLDHAYRLYGPESVVLSFNGGKDAVVILHLMRAAHAHYYQQKIGDDRESTIIVRPRALYFDHEHEFPEVTEFLHTTVARYDLDMIAFATGTKFSQGLQMLVEHNYRREPDTVVAARHHCPWPMAFVLGTRDTDPNAGTQGWFAPSSHYMPPFMRVNPIIAWTYGHVWHFLRQFHLPYCDLYDQGYTSLGSTLDTVPCPDLAVAGQTREGGTTAGTTTTTASAVPKYWPAYMLRDYSKEREGRLTKEQVKRRHQKDSMPSPAPTTSVPDSSASEHLDSVSLVRQHIALDRTAAAALDESLQSSSNATHKSVGLLIIGDEILKGYAADTNSFAAAQAFKAHNVRLERVAIVSDSRDDIVDEIRRLRAQKVSAIVTSGGVGPTHDDITIKCVAEALDLPMQLHEDMAQLLRDKMNKNDDDNAAPLTAELTEAQAKMATLPRNSKLRYLSDNPHDWPVLQCQNVFILPGVPEFFAKKIENVASYLSCQLERSAAYKVVLSVDETAIVNALNQVVDRHPLVSIGSYPFVSHPEFKTVITVEARLSPSHRNSVIFEAGMMNTTLADAELDAQVQHALNELIQLLPPGSVLRVDDSDMRLL